MHGCSGRGHRSRWHGEQPTGWRSTATRSPCGCHWAALFVPLNKATTGVPTAAARWAGPESAPTSTVACSNSAASSTTPSRPVQSTTPGQVRPSRIARAIMRSRHSADQHDVDVCAKRSAGRSVPASAPAATASPTSRPKRASPRAARWARATPVAAGLALGPRGSGETRAEGLHRRPAGCPGRPATRVASRFPGDRARIGPSRSSRNPPPPAAQPSRRRAPESQRIHADGNSPRTSIARSTFRRRSRQPCHNVATAQPKRPVREKRLIRDTWTRSTSGIASKSSRFHAPASTSIDASGYRRRKTESIPVLRIASPRWSNCTTRITRGSVVRPSASPAGKPAFRPAAAMPNTTAPHEIDHREHHPPAQPDVSIATRSPRLGRDSPIGVPASSASRQDDLSVRVSGVPWPRSSRRNRGESARRATDCGPGPGLRAPRGESRRRSPGRT